MTLFDLIATNAKALPNAPAVQSAGYSWSRAQLIEAAERAAQHLHAGGIQPGDRVASLSVNHAECLVLLLALSRLGAIWMPLNWRLHPQEWAKQCQQAQPSLLMHDPAHADAAQGLARALNMPCGSLMDMAQTGDNSRMDAVQGKADSPLLLVYTSGTTGEPNGAVHTQGNVLANIQAAIAAQQLSASDRVLSCLPLFHVGGLCIQTLPALAAGATVLLHERFDAGNCLQAIAQDRPTLTLQVPATLQALTQHASWPSTDTSSLRAVWAGSSIVTLAAMQPFFDRGIAVCNVYGSTETGPVSIVLRPERAKTHAGAVGWPAMGVVVRLLTASTAGNEDTCARVNPGLVDDAACEGELAIKAPNVASLYWPNRPALDADGFFRTGDMARQAADGCITVVGRTTEMLITGGENVYPAEVEQVLQNHPAVAQAAVFGVPNGHWGERVGAALVLNPGFFDEIRPLSKHSLRSLLQNTEQMTSRDLSAWPVEPMAPQHPAVAALVAHCQNHLAKYKCPQQLWLLDALPMTALGKVQKPLLQAALLGGGTKPKVPV